MKTWLLFAFLSIATVACSQKMDTTESNTYRMLAIGDSYTIGEAVEEEFRWPNQLKDSLAQHGILIDSVLFIAKTGWTTDELDTAIVEAGIQGQSFDFVTFSIGVNNQYRGRDTAEYRQQLQRLIEKVHAFSGGNASRVFVPSIPDWGVTPFARKMERDEATVAKEIDAYNAILKDEAEKNGFIFANITPHSRLAKNDTSMIASDGLHPGLLMYTHWVEELLKVYREHPNTLIQK